MDPRATSYAGLSPYAGMGNNPIIIVDEDGEWLHILIGALIGGTINLIANWRHVDSFWEGLGYFGVGAAAGATGGALAGAQVLAPGIGMASGMISGAGNAAVGGQSIIAGMATGGVFGGMGGFATMGIGAGMNSLFNTYSGQTIRNPLPGKNWYQLDSKNGLSFINLGGFSIENSINAAAGTTAGVGGSSIGAMFASYEGSKIDLSTTTTPYQDVIGFIKELPVNPAKRGLVDEHFVRSHVKGGKWNYGYNRSDNPVIYNGERIDMSIQFDPYSKLTGRIGRTALKGPKGNIVYEIRAYGSMTSNWKGTFSPHLIVVRYYNRRLWQDAWQYISGEVY